MATNTDRIDQLEAAVNELKRIEAVREVQFEQELRLLRTELRHHADSQSATRDDLAKAKAETESLRATVSDSDKRNAVLEAAVKELKAGSEKWGQRWWQLAATLIVGILGWIAGRLTKS